MKKLVLETTLLALIFVFPMPVMAGVDVGISISLPPLTVFSAPPEVIVLPETNVYVVPDLEVDIFFYNGWWWRPWEGRWYRSRNYSSGWGYYRNVPSFYRGIPSGWRNDYREQRWRGHSWNYQRIPHQQVQRNWRNWEKNRHWEKQNTWGVQGLKPRKHYRQEYRKGKPRYREGQPRYRKGQPQRREAVKPQQSRPRHGKPERPERREAERHDKK